MSRPPLVDPRFPGRLRQLRTAAGLSLRELATAAYVGKSTLSELENGATGPSVEMAGHLDHALGAGGDLARMVTTNAEPARLGLVDVPFEPGRPFDATDVTRLRETVGQLVALDNAYGGDDTHRLALRVYATTSRKLACGAFNPAAETDLQAVVGEIGEVAAWLLYDADRQDESRRVNIEAMTVSRLAGDRAVELLELANMAMQSVHLRRGREALRIAEHVLSADRLTPRVAGLFHIRRARALAELGDGPRAMAALHQAGSLIGSGTTDRDPPWAWWIDANELAWHSAMLHADLGDHTRAVDLFASAVRDHPATGRRQYNNLAHLLDALTGVAAWVDAESVAGEILPYLDEIGSARTEHLLARAVTRIRRARVPDTLGDLASAFDARLSGVR